MATNNLIAMLFFFMFFDSQLLLLILFALLKMPKIVRPFADKIVNYLIGSQVNLMKRLNKPTSKLVMQILCFYLITISDTLIHCEILLQPLASFNMIKICIEAAMILEKVLECYHLIIFLFNCYYGKIFDEVNVLPELLQSLARKLLPLMEEEDVYEVALELCIDSSERLSCVIPLLPYLIKPLAYAIKGNEDDLIKLGIGILDGLIKGTGLCPTLEIPNITDVVYQVFWAVLISHLAQLMIKPLMTMVLNGIVKDERVCVGLRAGENWIQASLDSDFLEPSIANLVSQVILNIRPAYYPEWESNFQHLLKTLWIAANAATSQLLYFLVVQLKLSTVMGADHAMPSICCLALRLPLFKIAYRIGCCFSFMQIMCIVMAWRIRRK